MIYNLLLPYIHKSHIANLFHYITFRIGCTLLLSMSIVFYIAPKIIRFLNNIQKKGQPIRSDGPETHFIKAGTPTMGGVIIIISVCLTTLLFINLFNYYIWIVLFVFISFGIIGFIDDYTKISKNHSRGLKGKQKLFFQFIISLISCILLNFLNRENTNLVTIPFCKNILVDLSFFYLPFCIFVIVGASNAVNLTDGLDGLAIVPIAITASSFILITYLVGNSFYANYLQILYIPHVSELSIFCSAIVGSSLGFLWFNAQPAEIFMGDTGSLSLGSSLGIISVISKNEIVLGIIGGVFVLETLSVILQVYYFKTTGGKRIFKMAPLHHHFEQCGWLESKVVIRFWIIAVIFALLGLSSLKLR